ncbi:xanthine dehydrogenase accessory protein XdhC [Massilia sp. CCM 8733]|uniref:Xanthine dehydrogenase accessory protein XdhC n=1 Tax=Massilia mucilaginosa TaxID=2609282 RepID=A0ABX0NN17_9BURK|nr:xanthine dehydrogenase accessory protein XdhC [Massilia mucilaginosa]NHZ88153.1 xanthine dehydrogenase accessory protein XdhC [Massilia mucilaginosa]
MDDWLSAAGPAILVTVAIVEGSGPRECGAKMLVDATRVVDTIGGGHLEHRAIETARAMLKGGRARHFERYALGPSLGQCCGGVVHLSFELFDAAQAALLGQRRQDDSWRVIAIDGAPETALFDGDGRKLAGAHPPVFARDRGAYVMQEPDGRRWLVDPVIAPRAHLVLFGAGHVGTAIVRALAHLPCTVTWVDERDDMFPRQVPENVTVEATDVPEALVAAAPANASYLVMTHSHALDQRLTEAIMARPDVGWFGLIGSKTKRRQFEHRLLARGVDAARIDTMVCPIGLAGITNKAPAVIAASVCAQLLTVWEAMQQTPSAFKRIMAIPSAAITERI